MYKKINILSFLLLSLLIVTTVTVQSLLQHWSGDWDLDFWYIYNASIMSSGIQQEWYDHPATTVLSLYSIFYKIYSLVDHSFIHKINEIMDANDPNIALQKLFFVTRIFDSINTILIVFFTFKISKILSSKDLYAYFLTLTVVVSATFFQNLSVLNSEDWAVLFFLISFYFFLKFFIYNNITFLLLSGLFFFFSFFTKISILFLFIFIILLIPIFCEMYLIKSNSSIQKWIEKNFTLLFGSYLVFLLLYFIIHVFVLDKLDPFSRNAGLDVTIILTLNLIYMVFFLIISKFKYIKFKTYFSIFILFLLGFSTGIIIFLAIDILNIAKLNPKILVHLVKPFYKMLNFAYAPSGMESNMLGPALLGTSIDMFNEALLVLSKILSNFRFDNFLFIGLCLIFTMSVFKDLSNKNTYYFLFKIIIFTSLLFNTLLWNFRWWIEYNILVHILYVILLSVCFKNIPNNIIKFFCIISTIYILIFLPIKNYTYYSKLLSPRPSVLVNLCNNFGSHKPPDNYFIFERYSKQFNSDTFSKICNLPKSRFRGDKYVLE
mgnify:CR=1 FL=1|tara:strand:+ start:1409 stop:3049 length:1641 start_codon:yes stop_codon:yes gene_type:complete